MSAARKVAEYGDLVGDDDLSLDEADAVSKALGEGHAFVAQIPEWLADDKAVSGFDDCPTVAAGAIEHETGKAYLVSHGDDEDWFPKSQIVVYEATPDAELYTPAEGNK